LQSLGFPIRAGVDVVYSLGEYGSTEDSSDKTSRRQYASDRYRVLLMVGDDLGDFISAKGTPEERVATAGKYDQFWGERWVVLPNPTYGSWERAIYTGKTDDPEILRAKFAKLKVSP
jgi:predicted secreted acid phosphatase